MASDVVPYRSEESAKHLGDTRWPPLASAEDTTTGRTAINTSPSNRPRQPREPVAGPYQPTAGPGERARELRHGEGGGHRGGPTRPEASGNPRAWAAVSRWGRRRPGG